MSEAEDREIAMAFRAWIDLPADASPEQIWEARPGRVAVLRRLREGAEPIDFVEVLLNSATDEQSLAVTCAVIKDGIEERHPATIHAIFERSEEEPWATLSLHMFGPGQCAEGQDEAGWADPQINLAQAIEAYVWMGGELEPGETREHRYSFLVTDPLYRALHYRKIDPVPLLARLRRVAQNDWEEDHVLTGAFEDVCYDRPELREGIIAIAPAEWADPLRSLG
ncbi:hypothetical protein [Demequina sp.]|uniref:hypothetical protein n=1 Tax=Demequina sp. TaxID=2050685 RepID=UPI003D0C45F2